MSIASLTSPFARFLRPRASPSLLVNPAYAERLRRAGLDRPEDFLTLPQVIISGHPGRQVSRVILGTEAETCTAFLKREHRVPWKERLLNAWDGFGFTSKSLREAQTLEALRPHFSGCPDWIAAGEVSGGQSFLLVRELSGRLELRRFLQSRSGATAAWRRRFARKLARVLARLHESGFAHGDLYANHVLVCPVTEMIDLVDWQRAPRRGKLASASRWRDLATLSATLPDDLATPCDRLAFLSAYLEQAGLRPLFREALLSIRRLAASLSRRRHVRAKQLLPLAPGQQSLVCLEAENALCVTPAFLALWPSSVPDCLRTSPGDAGPLSRKIALPDGGQGLLVWARHRLPWYRWRGRARRTWTSPERLRMSTLFRLQRYGIEAPQVLAVGERAAGDTHVDAFLLTRQPAATQPLADWLIERAGQRLTLSERRLRREVLRQAGALLARLHDAGCYLRSEPAGIAVQASEASAPRLVVYDVAGLCIRRRFRRLHAERDLTNLCRHLALCGGSRTDELRIRRGYAVDPLGEREA
jgi:tRNA A-37 threonylcarbamoyl transferase component Bud32